MPKYETTLVIKAPRDFVYAQYADTNKLTKLTTAYKTIRDVRKEGDMDVVEADVEVMGTKGKVTVKRKYYPTERIEEEVDSDLATAKQIFTFTDVPEGTKLILAADTTPKGTLGKLLGPLAKGRMKKFSVEQFEVGKRYIEENRPR